jgi:hypothetical protein
MVFWRGYGIWVIIVPLGVYAVTGGFWKLLLGKGDLAVWLVAFNFIVSGAIIQRWGSRVNRPLDAAEAAMRDQAGNVGPRPALGRHSLYWIRMEYWGVLFVVLGVVLVVMSIFVRPGP